MASFPFCSININMKLDWPTMVDCYIVDSWLGLAQPDEIHSARYADAEIHLEIWVGAERSQ